ncbi:unnamed protein product [Amoebophrya sp. A120]|nr:unnamed protein product [Amoebophrya sp. A120]|eukprot:GSA120T00001192001.1
MLPELPVAALEERRHSCEDLFVEFLAEKLQTLDGGSMAGFTPKDFWNADVDGGRDHVAEANAQLARHYAEDKDAGIRNLQGEEKYLHANDWTIGIIMAMMPFCLVNYDLSRMAEYSRMAQKWPLRVVQHYTSDRLAEGCARKDLLFFSQVWDFFHEQSHAAPGGSGTGRSIVVWHDPKLHGGALASGSEWLLPKTQTAYANVREHRCRIGMVAEYLFQASPVVSGFSATRFHVPHGYCLNPKPGNEMPLFWPEAQLWKKYRLSAGDSAVPAQWHYEFQKDFRMRANFWLEKSDGSSAEWSYHHFRYMWLLNQWRALPEPTPENPHPTFQIPEAKIHFHPKPDRGYDDGLQAWVYHGFDNKLKDIRMTFKELLHRIEMLTVQPEPESCPPTPWSPCPSPRALSPVPSEHGSVASPRALSPVPSEQGSVASSRSRSRSVSPAPSERGSVASSHSRSRSVSPAPSEGGSAGSPRTVARPARSERGSILSSGAPARNGVRRSLATSSQSATGPAGLGHG